MPTPAKVSKRQPRKKKAEEPGLATLPFPALAEEHMDVSTLETWLLRLFPRATFAVSYGAKRNQMFNVIRISVLLALAVALFKEWLMRHL